MSAGTLRVSPRKRATATLSRLALRPRRKEPRMREDPKGPAPSNRPTRRAWRGVFWTAARVLAVGALAIGGARAQDPAGDESVAEIRDAYDKAIRIVRDNTKKVMVGEVFEFVDRCWKVYDWSAGEPEEYEALFAVVSLTSNSDLHHPKLEEHWRDALGKLEKDHVDDKKLVEFVMYPPAPPQLQKEMEQFLKNVEANTKLPDLKAAFEYKKLMPVIDQQAQGSLDEAKTADLIAKMKDLATRYADATVPFEKLTYKEWVASKIRAIESLKIGGPAPEIDGQDLDGVKFKLSDYRGKVVMLDFWGYW